MKMKEKLNEIKNKTKVFIKEATEFIIYNEEDIKTVLVMIGGTFLLGYGLGKSKYKKKFFDSALKNEKILLLCESSITEGVYNSVKTEEEGAKIIKNINTTFNRLWEIYK